MDGSGVAGVVLAGGEGRRMGGCDKGALLLAGRPLRAWVLTRLRTQVDRLAYARGHNDAVALAPGVAMLDEPVEGRRGPLAGILAAVTWAQDNGASWVLTVPVDGPFLPLDLAARLRLAAGPDTAVVGTRSGGRLHPTASLWRTDLAPALRAALGSAKSPPTRAVIEGEPHAVVTFDTAPYDPFLNINTPEDLAAAEALIAQGLVGVP